ncbi:serine/threonine protein kinase, partial [Streptomyces sp. 8K308]|uniref:serine/threonine-protein kinase n=1 Tax=Streptomyces sp. 8K308 TaxID=2530388 RepID=UPI001045E259
YRLLRRVGAGSTGVVWEAHDTALDRRVAVKILRGDSSRDPEIETVRFRREVIALVRTRHPNVVSVYDTGVHEREPYLVTEFLDGVSLHELVGRHGALASPAVRLIAVGVCEALAAVHAAGVLHRDVKPSNVSITTTGRVVLQDFGIARLIDQSAVTQANVRLGTPAFMAPESIQGMAPSPATDLYSLGLCLHLTLTGEAPLGDSDDIGPIIMRAVSVGARPLRGRGLGDPELIKLVDELCGLEPADRPQSAVEVLDRLGGPAPAGSPSVLAELVRRCLREEAVGHLRSVPEESTTLEVPEYLDMDAPVTGASPGPAAPGPAAVGGMVRSAPGSGAGAGGGGMGGARGLSGPMEPPELHARPRDAEPDMAAVAFLPRPPREVPDAALPAGDEVFAPAPPEPSLSLSMATLQLVMSNMTPGNAISRQREAVGLVLRGELREAARLLTTLSQFCLARFGPDHPTTLASQYWQAVCLARLGANGEALALFSRVSEHAGPWRDEGEGTDVRG